MLNKQMEEILAKAKADIAKAEARFKKSPEAKGVTLKSKVDDKPDYRLTYEEIKPIYLESGIKPSRSFYFFLDDGSPMIRVSSISSDKKEANPLGLLCIVKNARFLDEPSHCWTEGMIGSFLGLTSSYILGFRNGFDGNAPGHPQCSSHFHCGYDDGKALFEALFKDNLIPDEKHIPDRARASFEQKIEFHRVTG